MQRVTRQVVPGICYKAVTIKQVKNDALVLDDEMSISLACGHFANGCERKQVVLTGKFRRELSLCWRDAHQHAARGLCVEQKLSANLVG